MHFFIGRHDYTAAFALAEEFCASLEAPHKSIAWFENSAHMPNVEEPEEFQRRLIALGAQLCRGT